MTPSASSLASPAVLRSDSYKSGELVCVAGTRASIAAAHASLMRSYSCLSRAHSGQSIGDHVTRGPGIGSCSRSRSTLSPLLTLVRHTLPCVSASSCLVANHGARAHLAICFNRVLSGVIGCSFFLHSLRSRFLSWRFSCFDQIGAFHAYRPVAYKHHGFGVAINAIRHELMIPEKYAGENTAWTVNRLTQGTVCH